ncbi:MAG: hypothetical protein A2Z16_00610 [Chloroflexi bacterium RBG_16_54_18]|nr:MAG: hypothetical protein A2Z16_00610 [Chloroflexi bacterium RBG_16_54_18]
MSDAPQTLPSNVVGLPRQLGTPIPDSGPTGITDPVLQLNSTVDTITRSLNQLSSPIVSSDGLGGATPNDTVGDVGPNHYVQAINVSFQVFDKDADGDGQLASLAGPATIQSLWTSNPSYTGPCTSNRGDPIVLYDNLADRWLISGFSTNGNRICVAISQTADPRPSQGYYLYEFAFTNFPDYFKIGAWIDGYYVSANYGGSATVAVFDRANMLNGNPASFMEFASVGDSGAGFNVLLPGDIDGTTPPPAGANEWLYRQIDGDAFGGTDRLELYEVNVDWTLLQGTINPVVNINTAPFDSDLCGFNSFGCAPQPGTTVVLDPVNEVGMFRFPYRNYGDREVLAGNFTVDVDGNNSHGIRWFILQRTGGGAWSIADQGTYAPQPGGTQPFIHRFMGSAAMDRFGNFAVGYTATSSQNINPSARYTGRKAGDAPGLLPQPEVTLQAGAGTLPTTCPVLPCPPGGGNTVGDTRWGDYFAMTVDPVDDCTFWYTGDYVTAGGVRQSRIGSFRLDDCGTDLAIAKTANPSPATAGGQLIYTVTVINNGPLDATNVQVRDTLPSGVAFVTDTDSCVEGPVGTLTCDVGDIASSDTVSFKIKVQIAPSLTASGPTSITNTATVSADQQELDDTNNMVSITTIVDEVADLQLTKECKPDSPIPTGETATCTIFVDNLGPSDARDVVVTDTHLSNGNFTITSATYNPPIAPCTIVGGVVTCNLGTEPAGGRTMITVSITSSEQVDVNDTATVTSDTPDPDTSNNIAKGKITFTGVADLSVTKTDIPDPVVAGTNLTYTITATNNGPSTAPNVVVKDVMPAQVSMISFTPTQGSCNGGVPGDPLQPLTCNLDTLTNGGSATITVVVKVNPSTPEGTILVNNTVVSSDHADPNNGNNNVTASTTVQARADLSVTKTSDKNVYKPSTLISYTVTVVNNGHSDALSVVVTDDLPPIKQALFKSDTGGCTKVANTLTCNMGNMAVGTSKSFNIYLVVKGSRGSISNTASVSSSTIDPVPANNTSTKVVTIGGK